MRKKLKTLLFPFLIYLFVFVRTTTSDLILQVFGTKVPGKVIATEIERSYTDSGPHGRGGSIPYEFPKLTIEIQGLDGSKVTCTVVGWSRLFAPTVIHNTFTRRAVEDAFPQGREVKAKFVSWPFQKCSIANPLDAWNIAVLLGFPALFIAYLFFPRRLGGKSR